MKLEVPPKNTYEVSTQENKLSLCSFACANRIRSKFPDGVFWTQDFQTKEKIDAKSAYFFVKSNKVSRFLENAMPPHVVSFKSLEEATKFQNKMGDGQIVHGFDAARRIYE